MSRGPLIAIIGRTNVGKSTLFNAIAGQRLAIVEDQPGVTRDRAYTHVTRHGFPFTLVDTGGLVGEETSEFRRSVRQQTELAISEADLILALFDGLHPLHPGDYEVVELLRKVKKKVLWVANKCEKPNTVAMSAEFYSLGIENLHCISAAHNLGIPELIEEMRSVLEQESSLISQVNLKEGQIRVALVGRPNVGKSTFVNKILGEERVISSEIPGTTRDSIDIELKRDGQEFVLVDTAGLRKRAKIDDSSIERFSALRTLRALAQSDVAVLLLDGTLEHPSEQDVKIAGLIHDRGLPFIIVVNKWDLVEKDHKTSRAYTEKVREAMKFCRYAPVLFVSALTGRRCPSVLTKAREVHANSQLRIQTGDLNRLLDAAFKRRQAPVYRGEPIKLYFATQVGVTPPTIVLFVNHPRELPFSYQRYLKNSIRKHYAFEGSALKLVFRKKSDKEDRLLEVGNA